MYRIAFLSVHASPLARLGSGQAGGMNVYVRELSRELGQRGLSVDIFTRRSEEGAPQIVELAEGVRVVHLEAGPARAIPKERLVWHLRAFRNSLLAFQEEHGLHYDLLHSHYWLSGWVAERVKRRWGVPHVAMFHTLGEVKNQARISEREPSSRIRAERAVAGGADRIICASQHEKELLVRLYGADARRIAVVPCGVDVDFFRPIEREEARRRLGLCNGRRIILFVGRIEPLKGVDILIGAAAQLHGQEDFSVLIVGGESGTPGEVEKLREQAVTLGVDHHVSFVGAVEQEKLPLFYSAADVCVVPSFYESFGLVAIEAMACGTPVVASRVGGLSASVRDGETGYLISWRCGEPFAERLELLLGNEELRRAFGRAAREEAERFRWAKVAEGVLEVYGGLRGPRGETPPAGSAEPLLTPGG